MGEVQLGQTAIEGSQNDVKMHQCLKILQASIKEQQLPFSIIEVTLHFDWTELPKMPPKASADAGPSMQKAQVSTRRSSLQSPHQYYIYIYILVFLTGWHILASAGCWASS